MSRKIITGDNTRFKWQLRINGTSAPLGSVTSIKVGLVSVDHTVSYTSSPIELNPSWPEAAWSTGLLEVRIPDTATSSITYQGKALLEASVNITDDVEDLTWYLPVEIIRGQVA